MFDAIRKMRGANVSFVDGVSAGTSTLVAAQGAGKKIVVDSITVSWSANAQTLVIKDNTTAITPTFTLIAAGGIFTIYDPFLRSSPNTALQYTTTGAGTVSIMVRWHVEE